MLKRKLREIATDSDFDVVCSCGFVFKISNQRC